MQKITEDITDKIRHCEHSRFTVKTIVWLYNVDGLVEDSILELFAILETPTGSQWPQQYKTATDEDRYTKYSTPKVSVRIKYSNLRCLFRSNIVHLRCLSKSTLIHENIEYWGDF